MDYRRYPNRRPSWAEAERRATSGGTRLVSERRIDRLAAILARIARAIESLIGGEQ